MVLSKLFAGKLGLKLCHAECYELSHTWNPNCFLAIYDALLPGTIFTLKTYGILYLIKSLVDTRGHINKIEWKNLFYKTIRSSLFIISTCVLFLSWSCAFRRLIGFVTWPTISFLNGFVTCLVTIWIESKQRRVMLLPYLLNLTSEALFRQAESRKLLRHIKFGESILFGFSTGVIYLIIGIKNVCLSMPSVCEQYSKMSKSKLFLQKLLKYSHGVLPENGGINEVKRTLKISSRNFLASFILLQLYNLFKQQNNFKSYSLLKFPLFLASMPLFFQFFTSILYKFKFFKQKYNIRQALSIASSSFLSMAIFWKNNTLALYTFWKMIELIYYWLICSHYLPIIPFGDAFLFCSVSSYLLGLAVLEPHLLRSNYYKFLCSATGNKLQLFNRPLFDAFFGFNSSKLYRNFWPKLKTNLLTINPSLYCSKPQHFHIF